MPFQSEAQRRYLWANEPEIARDWTDTYGSGIAKALGGRIQYQRVGPGPGGQGARGQATQNPGRSSPSGPGPGGQGARGQATQNPGITTPSSTPLGGDRIIDIAQRKKRQDIRDLLAQQQAEKDYTRQGIRKTGPQLALAGSGIGGGGIKNFLGNWGSAVGGSQLGGGLGSMLFGPWGALLGAIFGQGVGRRGWKASQTDEKETAKDILLGQNTLLSNLFSKKKTPTNVGGEGDQGILGIKDKINQLGTREGPTTRDTWNIKRPITRSNLDTGTVEHDVWGGPLEEYDPRFDLQQTYREWMNERMPETYSEHETIPNPEHYGLDIGRNYLSTDDLQLEVGPYEGERYKITDMENI